MTGDTETECADSPTFSDHEHSYTVDVGNLEGFTVSACRSDFDTVLSLYAGLDTTGAAIYTNDDASSCADGTRSVLTAPALSPGDYTLLVEGYGTAKGNYTLAMTCVTAAPLSSSPSTNFMPRRRRPVSHAARTHP